MAGIKITDLVDPKALADLKELQVELNTTKEQYIEIAKELAQGLNLKVEVTGDLEKLNDAVKTKTKEAADATEKLNKTVKRHNEIVANTTNTISRKLMEQERVNKATREAWSEDERYKKILEEINGTYENRVKRLIQVSAEITKNKDAQKSLTDEWKNGKISQDEYEAQMVKLVSAHRELSQEKANLNTQLKNEEREMQTVSGSYNQLSQRLELLKKSYKNLSEEERNSDMGKEMESAIQDLDAHLKDMSADMGEFQRNVGNYAIAADKGAVSTEEINRAMKTNARTIEEAEQQNKVLVKAIKQIDVTSDDAADKIEAYSAKIEENSKMIKQNTGESEGLVESMGDLLGINTNFGNSLQSLAQNSGGNVFEGLKTKASALGKTLMGLVSNPYVLALLGIVGVAAGFKWWYDYNKGLVKATKLTQDFTGLTGDALKIARNEVQALADMYDKEFEEVLQAVNAVSKQYGMSFQDAFTVVKDGFVAGADANGEFLENLKEYPAYFKEAGISASQFIAITTQANKSGIYSDKGIDVIKEANLRIREMTKSTADALDAIGISSAKVQEELANGSKTTFDIMQEVSAKLAEFPESSAEVGTAIADIFGGPGEDAGLQYILTLQDIQTNLDVVKEETGILGQLQEEQMESQIELENTLSSVFDATGGSFETMTTKAKIFINKGLVEIIKGAVGVINYFRNLYNDSIAFRVVIEAVVLNFKNMWNAGKQLFTFLIEQVKTIGDALHGAFTLNWDEVTAAWKRGAQNIVNFTMNVVNGTKDNFDQMIKNVQHQKLEPITLDIEFNTGDFTGNNVVTTNRKKPYTPNGKGGGSTTKPTTTKVNDTNEAREYLRQKQEELRILDALNKSEIDLMEEGLDKTIALIKYNYAKKIQEIKGNSDNEVQLRANLLLEMENKIAEANEKAAQKKSADDLKNKLAAAEKGSKEEYEAKKKQIEKNRDNELAEAKKTGADLALINAKYNKQLLELDEEYANQRAELKKEEYSSKQVDLDLDYSKNLAKYREEYKEKLLLAKGNREQMEAIEAEYNNKVAEESEKYSQDTVQNTINMLNEMLKIEDLSADERLKLQNQLNEEQVRLNDLKTEAEINNTKRVTEAEAKAFEKRMENMQKWVQVASDSISAITDLANALFDSQIEKIEHEQEVEEEAKEKQLSEIEELVEQKVITEEEGEARKRAAEAKSEQKHAELEKKKQALEYKQAVWQKATDLAQAGIATALAIIQALPDIPLSIAVGAMGAIQMATIAATPIPKYAKGTGDKGHIGGLALVGDGGKHEIVLVDGGVWVTPDTPTLVDMPKGAVVYPDVDKLAMEGLMFNSVSHKDTPNVVVNNDYHKLEKGMMIMVGLMRAQLNQTRRTSYYQQFRNYINSRI